MEFWMEFGMEMGLLIVMEMGSGGGFELKCGMQRGLETEAWRHGDTATRRVCRGQDLLGDDDIFELADLAPELSLVVHRSRQLFLQLRRFFRLRARPSLVEQPHRHAASRVLSAHQQASCAGPDGRVRTRHHILLGGPDRGCVECCVGGYWDGVCGVLRWRTACLT